MICFNTGRYYSENGQRILAVSIGQGVVWNDSQHIIEALNTFDPYRLDVTMFNFKEVTI